MSTPLYTCPHCGANLSLDQLRGTDCPYCRSAFPHHARAVEHAALVNQVMAQNIATFAVAAPMVHFGAPLPNGPTVATVATVAQLRAPFDAHVAAMKRINRAVALGLAIAMASAIGFVIAFAVLFR